ncbi:MAG: hypothetical protein GY853_05935 [PVC group bacterium]|nr:hypothetical protein [PVC group bacterium]
MRKTIIFIFIFLLISQYAYAHPPSAIKIKYDKEQNLLVVLINHRASRGKGSQARKHYIEEILIKKGKETIETKTFTRQKNDNVVKVTFPVPEHENNSKITIEAKCNKFGQLSKEIALDALLK